MQLSFASTKPPVTLRVCRSLVWTQAAFALLGGAFILFAAVVFGTSNAIPFRDGVLSGTGAAMLGAVYLGSGMALVWLGAELSRPSLWARTAIVSMQVFLALLQLFRSLDLSASTLISVVLYTAIVALLFAPDSQRAIAASRGG